MIYCFDIDGTICSQETDYNLAKPKQDVIHLINKLYHLGNTIVFYTARGYVTGINWEEITLKQLNKWNVKYHKLVFGKPNADFYVDDKMVSTTELNQRFIYKCAHTHNEMIKQPLCPRCESRYGYVKLRTKEWVCRQCGKITKLKDLKAK